MDADPIVAEFVAESREHLDNVESQLLEIEARGANIDIDLVNSVFRAVHSIKGAAGFLGLEVIGRLSHDLENLLNLIRERELVPSESVTSVMLSASDALLSLFDDVSNSNEVDISLHSEALQAVLSAHHASQNSPTRESASPEPKSDQMPSEESTPPAEGYAADPEFSPKDAPTPVADPRPELTNQGTTFPEAASEATSATASPESAGAIAESSTNGESTNGESATPSKSERAGDSVVSASREGETNIRVAVGVLDRLMNLAGELVLSRNQLLQAVGSAGHEGLDSVVTRLDQVTSELQEAIMQTRMQVVGKVFSKFPRVVRDMSRQLGKACHLEVEGEDVELDKSVIEAIGDPLTHLVRNAVDHGMETPDERAAAGKPTQGTIELKAYHQAGKVTIAVVDDGRGIDPAKLRDKAIACGILTNDQAREMSDREAMRLIFHPGFTTAEKVTDVSGRGVGMDVVRTNVEKLGGTIEIDSKLGEGTCIDVRLPLTLAIIPSLIIRSGESRYAVPQANIDELVGVKASELAEKIQNIKGSEVLRLRGALLPLIRLDETLGMSRNTSDVPMRENESVHIVVLESGGLTYGLVVDGVHDSEEIVVRPLGRHLQKCRTLAGATVLGDGRVALILDVAGIATEAELRLPAEGLVDQDMDADSDDMTDLQSVLLVTNHPEECFAIPMELIARLEYIDANQIDAVGGREVLQYRGRSLPLFRLETLISASPLPDSDKLYVIVYTVSRREVGLIVPNLIDVRQIPTDVDTSTFREVGVMGSLVVDEKAVRLLDLYELVTSAHPDWFTEQEDERNEWSETEAVPRILVAEDSDFFRKQLVSYLTAGGYETVACEDGRLAWETLSSRQQEFQAVVTDVEMPRMDGLQLTRAIKADPELCSLPVIAVTSLASEEDIKRGREAGVDAYHVKLDRERLIEAVHELVRKESPAVAAQ